MNANFDEIATGPVIDTVDEEPIADADDLPDEAPEGDVEADHPGAPLLPADPDDASDALPFDGVPLTDEEVAALEVEGEEDIAVD